MILGVEIFICSPNFFGISGSLSGFFMLVNIFRAGNSGIRGVWRWKSGGRDIEIGGSRGSPPRFRGSRGGSTPLRGGRDPSGRGRDPSGGVRDPPPGGSGTLPGGSGTPLRGGPGGSGTGFQDLPGPQSMHNRLSSFPEAQ